MAGADSTDAAVSGAASDGGCGRVLPASLLVATVADLLAMHIQSGHLSDAAVFSDLCLSLARGIDYAVANDEIPLRAQDLPLLLKQVLRRMNDSSLQGVAMVLMISVKNACLIGWFPEHDADDLLRLAQEIGKNFSTMEDINIEPSNFLLNVQKIMLRYYPRLRMDHILASLEVKPGYGAFVVDFHITRSMVSSVQKYICLFVAQMDNTDTPLCIVTPPQANFLLNGKGVQGRINVSMDNGPQLPTNVTRMLKYGINLLQVVGQFNGTLELQDYTQPAAVMPDPDLEIMEGQSRISLNCPISFKRIKIPVKGHLCKHHQCFDYSNFIEINSRRPSWRCPHCHQFICNSDIRIDQNMVKILREVGENVGDVIISPDGSWKPVVGNIEHTEQMYDSTQSNGQEKSEHCEPVGFSNIPADTVDLTMGEDNEDESPSDLGTEDAKPLWENLQKFSAAEKIVPPDINNMVEADQHASVQTEDNVRSEVVFSPSSTSCGLAPITSSNAHKNLGIPGSLSSFMPSSVLTDAISPSLYWGTSEVHRETQLPISSPQNQYSDPSSLQLQQSRFGSSIASNEYGRVASIPRQVIRNPIAVQALPAQDQLPRSSQSTRLMPNAATTTGSQTASSMAPSAEGFVTANRVPERVCQFSRPPMSSPASSQSVQHVVSPPNLRTTQATNERRNIARPHLHLQPVLLKAATTTTNRQSPLAATSQQTAQVSRTPPSVPVHLRPARTAAAFSVDMVTDQLRTAGGLRRNTAGTTWSTARPNALAPPSSEENWRPSGRMRGSLTGEAYSAALNQFFLQTSQPPQPPRPPRPPTNPTSNFPGGLPALRTSPGNEHPHSQA